MLRVRLSGYGDTPWSHISADPLRSTFADASHGFTGPHAAMVVNEFLDVPISFMPSQLAKEMEMKFFIA
jgi:hypothetical protein